MPNIATILKQEVSRLARRELRSETESLKKQVARYRSEIAALKRRLEAVEKQGKKVAKTVSRAAPQEQSEESGTKLRFRADGFAKKRQTLGLSAKDAGQILGVSGLTVYKWEKGQARPRATQMPAIAAFRRLGVREARIKLEKSPAA